MYKETCGLRVFGDFTTGIGCRENMERALAKLAAAVFVLFAMGGCSSYKAASYTVVDPGGVAVVEARNETYQDEDLVGKKCRLRLSDGTKIQGKILDVTEAEFLMDAEIYSYPSRSSKNIEMKISKRDIVEFELKNNKGGSMSGLVVAAAAMAAIYLVQNWTPGFN